MTVDRAATPTSGTAPKPPLVAAGAVFSEDARYRYLLWRFYTATPRRSLLFVMLNPSTADEKSDDPTIRRCVHFALARGYERLAVVNLFAYRATNPAALRQAPRPIGPENDAHIEEAAKSAAAVVCAWGQEGVFLGRGTQVHHLLRAFTSSLLCFGLTKNGQPRHPLYLPGNAALRPWGGA